MEAVNTKFIVFSTTAILTVLHVLQIQKRDKLLSPSLSTQCLKFYVLIMKGNRSLLVFLVLSCISWVQAERINSIATKTSDCFFCGMVEGVGFLTVQVCGSTDCCLSRSLDSDGSIDWLPGATDIFQGTK